MKMYRQNLTLPFLQVKDTPYTVFYCGEVAVGEQRYEALYLFGASVPPFQFKQEAGHFVVETLSERFCRISGHYSIRLHVGTDHTSKPDDGAVADVDARQYGGVLTDPYVVAHHGITLYGEVLHGGRCLLPPHDIERICGSGVHLVVCTVHDECYSCCYLAELTDDKSVADEIVVMQDMLFEIHIAEICEISDDDIRVGYGGLHVGK